jgi:hypothetical protein
LTLDDIYHRVDRDLSARGLPRPQRRATNSAGSLMLSRGPGAGPPLADLPPDEIRFRRDKADFGRLGRVIRRSQR